MKITEKLLAILSAASQSHRRAPRAGSVPCRRSGGFGTGPCFFLSQPLQVTEKRRSQRPESPSARVPPQSHQDDVLHVPSPPRSRTITNYHRAQRAAGNHRLLRPRRRHMRSAAQSPVPRPLIRRAACSPRAGLAGAGPGEGAVRADCEGRDQLGTLSWGPFLSAPLRPCVTEARDSLAEAPAWARAGGAAGSS